MILLRTVAVLGLMAGMLITGVAAATFAGGALFYFAGNGRAVRSSGPTDFRAAQTPRHSASGGTALARFVAYVIAEDSGPVERPLSTHCGHSAGLRLTARHILALRAS